METTYTFGLFFILLAFPVVIFLIMIIKHRYTKHRYTKHLLDKNKEIYEKNSDDIYTLNNF